VRFKISALLFLILFSFFSYAQDKEKAASLVKEGIRLHDAGKYDDAIQKYREALSADPSDANALYEMSFSFYVAGKYDSCIEVSNRLMSMNISDEVLKNVYVNLGSCYDGLKQPDKSIKIYDKGLKKFPDFYLLYFNKGITNFSNDNQELAEQNFQDALMHKPTHTGSYYVLAKILYRKNKIPAIMAASMVCILESGGKRAKECSTMILDLMQAGIKKDSGKTNITIYLPAEGRKKENDFSAQELMLSLMSVSPEVNDSLKLDTEDKKLSFTLQILCNGLAEDKKNKGFYWKFYAPFFYDLKKNGFTDILVHFILAQNNDYDAAWIQSHSNEVSNFSDWFKKYDWAKK
jgi:hypothetical protein